MEGLEGKDEREMDIREGRGNGKAIRMTVIVSPLPLSILEVQWLSVQMPLIGATFKMQC